VLIEKQVVDKTDYISPSSDIISKAIASHDMRSSIIVPVITIKTRLRHVTGFVPFI
jgi:hypothetical protein